MHGCEILENEGLSKSFILILPVSDASHCLSILNSLKENIIENV